MKSVTNTYICKSNTAGKSKEGRLSPNTLSLHVNYSPTFSNFLQIMVVYLLIFFCYDLNSASSSSLFSFIFTTYVNCALNAFLCCTSLRVDLQSTFSNRLYLPITKFIDPLCSASKIIILCVQCDFTTVFILKDDLRDTTQN